MRYFVIGPDNQRYGPAEMMTLQEWARQGRIQSETTLVDEMTQNAILARDVPGLFAITAPPPMEYRPLGSSYSRPTEALNINSILVKSILVLVFCCQPLGIVAVVFAALASSNTMNQPTVARDQIQKANTWANWGLGIGVSFYTLYFLFIIMMAVTGNFKT